VGFLYLHRYHQFWTGSVPWFCLLFLTVNVCTLKLQKTFELARAKNLLQIHEPTIDQLHQLANGKEVEQPRYDWSTGEELEHYWPYIPDATQQSLIIVSGMSQMHSISHPIPGDKIISEYLDDALTGKGVRVFGLAAPNLNNEEALFLLLSSLSNPRTRPYAFIYGVCFDKFRNLDLRPGYQSFLKSQPQVQALWQATAMEFVHTYPMASEKMLKSLELLKVESVERDTLEAKLRQFV